MFRASVLVPAGVAVVSLVVSALGCDSKPPPGAQASAQPTASEAVPAPVPVPVTSAKRTMPPRPVPLGSSGPIQPGDPAETQMMAISYTLAMLAPNPTDPLVDKTYVEATVKKLATAVPGMDKGQTPREAARAAKGNRKLETEMGKGCTDRTPAALMGRAGTSLKQAYEAGVLVVSCHDDKWECHQSTRDESDVLCLASPRGRK